LYKAIRKIPAKGMALDELREEEEEKEEEP
jgi:hypothetical protein